MILINTARGPIVDIDALYDAMKDGTVLAAGLDVLPEEPANPQSRLIAAWQRNEDWIRHRLVLTPHSAFYTPESMRDNRAFASRTAARYLRDGRLENCVNKQFLVATELRGQRHEGQGRRSDHRLRRLRRGGGLEPRRDADEHPLPGAGRLDEAVRLSVQRAGLRGAGVQRLRHQPEHPRSGRATIRSTTTTRRSRW